MSHRKLPIISGATVLFGSVLLFLFGTHLWMLALARVLQGFANTCIWTLGMTMIADSFSADVIGTAVSQVTNNSDWQNS